MKLDPVKVLRDAPDPWDYVDPEGDDEAALAYYIRAWDAWDQQRQQVLREQEEA